MGFSSDDPYIPLKAAKVIVARTEGKKICAPEKPCSKMLRRTLPAISSLAINSYS